MIEGPGVWWRFHEDDVTRQQVRPGTARRVWPYLRRYRGPVVLLVFITAVDAAIVVIGESLVLELRTRYSPARPNLAERGTHDELLAAGGVYAGLYRTQFASQAA